MSAFHHVLNYRLSPANDPWFRAFSRDRQAARATEALDTRSKELMKRHKAHDPTAMEELYELHARGIRAFVKTRVADRSHREDASQSVWLAVLELAPVYEQTDELFHVWLYSIAARTCRDFVWGDGTERTDVAIYKAFGCDKPPEERDAFEWENRRETLERAFEKVPAEEREAFKLKYADGLSDLAIGRLLGTDERDVYGLIDRCLERLANALADVRARKAA